MPRQKQPELGIPLHYTEDGTPVVTATIVEVDRWQPGQSGARYLLTIHCPYCGRHHTHGGGWLFEELASYAGHRVAHCVSYLTQKDPSKGYILTLNPRDLETDSHERNRENRAVAAFVRSRCVTYPQASQPSRVLYAAYQAWEAEHKKQVTLHARAFAQELRALGYGVRHTRTGQVWNGLKLREQEGGAA